MSSVKQSETLRVAFFDFDGIFRYDLVLGFERPANDFSVQAFQ
jgi:hypothetical protein